MSLHWYAASGASIDLAPAHRRWRFWIEQGRDELAEARRTSGLVPFRRGRLHRAGTADVRKVVLRGYIQEATDALLLATRDTLKGLLDTETPAPGVLVDEMEDGSTRWIRAVPDNLIARFGGVGTRLLSIELEAVDPYWYGSYGFAALDSGLLLDDGGALDQGAWIVITPTATVHPLDIDTLGTAETERVRVELTGPSSAPPGLEVVTPDGLVGFSLGAALAAGQVVELDNSARTVVIAGVSQRAGMVLRPANRHGEYVRLLPGRNTVRILGQPARARILFTPTYW